MSRPVPPMYQKVQRKIPPTARRVPTAPAASVAPVAPPLDLSPTPSATGEGGGTDLEEEEDALGEEEEDASSGSLQTLSQRNRKKLSRWSEEMSQRKLYALAKDVGLDVRSRDSKEDLIAKIKEALG